MSELGYYEPPFGGIIGTANPATDSDPVLRAALQNEYAQMAFALTTAAGYVPPGTGHSQSAPEWATQPGLGNPPVIGWTVQNAGGRPAFPPYTAQGMGRIPDWTSDPNPNAAGQYDMTPVRSDNDYNPLNRGPIGAPFFDAPGAQEPDNPNTSSQFSQGSSGQSLEW